jgi:hypothetical protein
MSKTASGVPMAQPSGKDGAGGRSAGLKLCQQAIYLRLSRLLLRPAFFGCRQQLFESGQMSAAIYA